MTAEVQQISDYWVLLGKVRITCQLLLRDGWGARKRPTGVKIELLL